MRRMRARTLAALVALLGFALGCRARSSVPRSADGGAVTSDAGLGRVVTAPNAPTLVECGPSGCPRLDDAAAARDGGELVVHVEAEPAILCDLVEHDAWSRWIAENQIMETLLYQDPWSGKITPRLAASFELTAEAL